MEYGLTDIQEYYANTGALKKAAESRQAKDADPDGQPARRVGVSVVEAYGKEVAPRELEATLRIEYRSKLLNPKWAEAMSNQVRWCRVICSWWCKSRTRLGNKRVRWMAMCTSMSMADHVDPVDTVCVSIGHVDPSQSICFAQTWQELTDTRIVPDTLTS